MDFSALGVGPGELLTPAPPVKAETWACVACDQYTSQPEYWEEAARLVGDAPSCLRMVLPECCLPEAAERIPRIHREMARCLEENLFAGWGEKCMMLVERTTQSGCRLGLVCLVDLEAYDFTGEKSLVRPTEETITARLPARQAVRRHAPLETSHVMLLIDDPQRTVIEPLYRCWRDAMDAYDFELMQGGGHLRGKRITDPLQLQAVADALSSLKAKQGEAPLLFAVGDGNHSLATARAHWLELRLTLPPEERESHPARFAMAEIVNIHDPALNFEPIHRLLTGVDGEALLADWAAYAAARGMQVMPGEVPEAQVFTFITGEQAQPVSVLSPDGPLPVATLQRYLDDFLARHSQAEIDYIHGDDVLRRLAGVPGCAGFLLPALDKSAFFHAIDVLGTLPRKTFSMGHAHEKRCYMECRKIVL